jgi:hypothetical protein
MQTKNNKTLFDVSAVTTDQTSDVQDMGFLYGYSVQFIWVSTTCVATFKMQASNDGTNWIDVTNGSQAIANNSGSVMLNLDAQYPAFVRGVIDMTSGTLTSALAVMNSKG